MPDAIDDIKIAPYISKSECDWIQRQGFIHLRSLALFHFQPPVTFVNGEYSYRL